MSEGTANVDSPRFPLGIIILRIRIFSSSWAATMPWVRRRPYVRRVECDRVLKQLWTRSDLCHFAWKWWLPPHTRRRRTQARQSADGRQAGGTRSTRWWRSAKVWTLRGDEHPKRPGYFSRGSIAAPQCVHGRWTDMGQ